MSDDNSGLTFHYSREERISRMPRPLKRKDSGRGRKKRFPFLIIVLEVVIIFLLAVSLPKLFKADQKTLGAYSFKLTGYVYDGKPLVSLTIKRTGDDPAPGEGSVSILFSLSGNETSVYQFLPSDTENPVVVRTSFQAGRTGEILSAVCVTEEGLLS
jgi:hypothetical protein